MTQVAGEIRAENLLKELAGVWKDLGKQEADSAVIRACSMTLIVAAEGVGDESEIAGTLGDLMRTHPGRYIVLRISDTPEPEFSARVFAQCQLAFGRRQQLCCEQIEFTATRDSIPDFYAVALGLLVADLPVLLWIRSAALLFEPAFQAVLPLARPLILDSSQLPNASADLAKLLALRRAGWRIKDLAWTRLTIWRETVAQMFESSSCRDFCLDVDRIEVTAPPPECFYLAGWLSSRLPKAAVSVTSGPVRRLRLTAAARALEIAADGDALIASGPDGMPTRVQGAALSDAELLAEELSILGPDPAYDAALADAERLARP